MLPEAFEAVVAPKVLGAQPRHGRGPPPLSLFFSSTAGAWSQSGAAHYSAANAYLSAVARYKAREARAGCSVVSLCFGRFAEAGMAAQLRWVFVCVCA